MFLLLLAGVLSSVNHQGLLAKQNDVSSRTSKIKPLAVFLLLFVVGTNRNSYEKEKEITVWY